MIDCSTCLYQSHPHTSCACDFKFGVEMSSNKFKRDGNLIYCDEYKRKDDDQ